MKREAAMDKHFPIGTERLLLRPFTEGDLPDVLKIFGDEEINRYLPWFPQIGRAHV